MKEKSRLAPVSDEEDTTSFITLYDPNLDFEVALLVDGVPEFCEAFI